MLVKLHFHPRRWKLGLQLCVFPHRWKDTSFDIYVGRWTLEVKQDWIFRRFLRFDYYYPSKEEWNN
jgi:hypothetical protein